jgi:outer membrane murein-binding lipoprotein Lpp
MEEYKIIKNFEKYSVSNFGNVKNSITEHILKPADNGQGYLCVSLSRNGKGFNKRVNRLVAEAFLENPNNKPYVDHIDNNRANNRLENLRWATFSENQMNSSLCKVNTSGVKGVHYYKPYGKWMAHIRINRKKITIGYFKTLEEAQQARMKKANELFGEFTNKIEKIKTDVKNVLNELEQLEQEFNNIGK